ncbi:MAG: 5-deoxy-glucuronate isomerase [Clostridiales bacterium]|nr:5-deoxy-glucuronate isomerase [Clostridiales bacterium]
MNLYRKYEGQSGYTAIAGGDGSSLGLLELGYLKLSKDQTFEMKTGDSELVIVMMTGICAVRGEGFSFGSVGGRRDVFAGPAHSVYIPVDTAFEVTCLENMEAAFCYGKADRKLTAFEVKPSDVPVKELGILNLKRGLHSLIDDRLETCSLCIGEAYTYPGNWSSYPPHKHDVSELPFEAVMEEIYFFKFNLPSGFGFQAVYTEDGSLDEVYRVGDNTAVEVPRGYHPFACAPGYSNYMLYLMAGEKRSFYRRTQPCHQWIEAAERMVRYNL